MASKAPQCISQLSCARQYVKAMEMRLEGAVGGSWTAEEVKPLGAAARALGQQNKLPLKTAIEISKVRAQQTYTNSDGLQAR